MALTAGFPPAFALFSQLVPSINFSSMFLHTVTLYPYRGTNPQESHEHNECNGNPGMLNELLFHLK